MNVTDTPAYKEWREAYSKDNIDNAIKSMPDYGGLPFDHWVMSPTPSYFDCGDDTCFALYAADSTGSCGDAICIEENEWKCYSVACDLVGEGNFVRSTDYSYIWNKVREVL